MTEFTAQETQREWHERKRKREEGWKLDEQKQKREDAQKRREQAGEVVRMTPEEHIQAAASFLVRGLHEVDDDPHGSYLASVAHATLAVAKGGRR